MSDQESVFATHRAVILEQERLQALVLHLYNSDQWPFNLGNQLTQLDAGTLSTAIALMISYHRHGENDEAFLALGRQLADYRIEQKRQFDARLAELDEEVRRDNDGRLIDGPRFDAPRRDPGPRR